MRVKNNKKLVSWLLCMMLIVATALTTVGCGTGGQTENDKKVPSDAVVLGEGKTMFYFTVVEEDKSETTFEIHTDKEMVGEALMELNLITGDEGPYGLYVKEVNGITADYDVNKTFWAFYADGVYATSGVDVTPIVEGTVYSMKVEK